MAVGGKIMGDIEKRHEWVYQLFIVIEVSKVVRNGKYKKKFSCTQKWQRILHNCERRSEKSYKRSVDRNH